jgi:hypothetical protein
MQQQQQQAPANMYAATGLMSSTEALPESAAGINSSMEAHGTASAPATASTTVAVHAPQASNDVGAQGRMKQLMEEMTRLHNENLLLKERVKQHAPAAPTILADNAQLRASIDDLRQQLQIKDHEVSFQIQLQEKKSS